MTARFMRRARYVVRVFLRKRIANPIVNLDTRMFDNRWGVRTAGRVPMREYELSPDAVEHGTGFESMISKHFRDVIRSIEVSDDSVLLDVGCGKGKVLLLGAEHDFKRIVGIDVVPSLCEEARKNVELARSKGKGGNAEIYVTCINALDYDFTDEDVVVINNPFDIVYMEKFVERLSSHSKSIGRVVWLLYFNPKQRHVLDSSPYFELVAERRYSILQRAVAVYRSDVTGKSASVA